MLTSISIFLKRSGIVVCGIAGMVILSNPAVAAINTNGFLQADELAVGFTTSTGLIGTGVTGVPGSPVYDTHIATTFKNNHDGKNPEPSIYTGSDAIADVFYTEDLTYLYLYIGVPLFAKNMIWENAAYEIGFEGDSANHLVEADYLPYRAHDNKDGKDDYKLDYKTATESEDLVLGSGFGGTVYDLRTDGTSGYYTSLNYLLGNSADDGGSAWDTCDTSLCLARDVQFAYEFKLALSSLAGGDSTQFLAGVSDGIGVHLSDERRGAATNVIPVPAAFWLFGTAIFGLIGMRRKAKLAA